MTILNLMHSAIAVILANVAPPVEPPKPDFVTAVNYAGWLKREIRGEFRPFENAAADYVGIIGNPRYLDSYESSKIWGGGPRWNIVADTPMPWDPAFFPEWEPVQEERDLLMATFLKAATKPYMSFDRNNSTDAISTSRFYSDPMRRYFWSGLASCASDHAWRAPGGRPDVATIMRFARANLGLARQLLRDASMIAIMTAGAVKQKAYEDLLKCLELGIMSAGDKQAALDLLCSEDMPPPPIETICKFELADGYEGLQTQAWFEQQASQKDIEQGVFRLSIQTRTGLLNSRDDLGAFYSLLPRIRSLPWSLETAREIDELKRQCRRTESKPLIDEMTGNVDGALFLLTVQESNRRATRIVFEIVVEYDRSGVWPERLTDLRRSPREKLIDPIARQFFQYKSCSDGFELYSLGLNQIDDGGAHDYKWGREKPHQDYCFWPVPKR